MEEKRDRQEIEWKSDRARQERKERLARLKDKDGNKKPIQTKNKWVTIISLVVVVALLAGFGYWFALKKGFRQKRAIAFRISTLNEEQQAKAKETTESGEKANPDITGEEVATVTALRANIYAGFFMQQMVPSGLFTPAGQEAIKQASQFSPGKTLRDDLITMVKTNIKRDQLMYQKAQEKGMKLSDAGREQVDKAMKQMKANATQAQLTITNYINNLFGPGSSEEALREFLEYVHLIMEYQREYANGLTYDEATIKKMYDENPQDYDEVDFRKYSFTAETPPVAEPKGQTDASASPSESGKSTEKTTATGESNSVKPSETGEAKKPEPDFEKAKKTADEFNALLSDEASFNRELVNFVPEDKRDALKDENANLNKGGMKNSLTPDLGNWLFDNARQAFDHTVIKTATGYDVVMFLKRVKPEARSFTSRHILFKVDNKDDEKAMAEAKEKAEKVLAEYRSGEQTAEAFGELAKQHSADPGSAQKGGLYENQMPGTFVPEYEAFCLDPARKTGDVEIVKTQIGYHIIYFDHLGAPKWQATIENKLKNDDYQKFLREIDESTAISEDDGLKYFATR